MNNHPQTDEHITRCADCQAQWALAAPDVDLHRAWHGVAAQAWAPPVHRLEQIAGRLLRSPGLARALVTTPSLVRSWIIATVLVLGICVLLTHGAANGPPWVALFAPALAGAAIAYAYGPGIDPAWELSQTMVISDRQILLVRALAVFALNTLLGLVASLFSAEAAGLTLSWLAPMAMVSALALAGSTVARSANVGVVVALGGWMIAILLAADLRSDGRVPWGEALGAAVAGGALVPIYLAVAAMCVAAALWATRGRAIWGGTKLWQ